MNEWGALCAGTCQRVPLFVSQGLPASQGSVCDQQRVPLSCRARWCAGLWAASPLPSPRLPALTPRPCWPTPSPWLRTLSAPKSSLMCLSERRSEQVRGPQCRGNIREGTGDLSEPLVACSPGGPQPYPLGLSQERVFRHPVYELMACAANTVVWVLISFKSLALFWYLKWRLEFGRPGLSCAGLQNAREESKLPHVLLVPDPQGWPVDSQLVSGS